ncbi:MAG: hypothetical protein GY847_05045 [Proteobacteria bacterium]|nr:hypothetical protein [Pseudomonadota bacterium]
MKILEIIQLRSAAYPIKSLGWEIKESIRAAAEKTDIITIYRRDRLDSDLAIHIHRHEESEKGGPSKLGVRLASALKDYGLVEHTLWEELR